MKSKRIIQRTTIVVGMMILSSSLSVFAYQAKDRSSYKDNYGIISSATVANNSPQQANSSLAQNNNLPMLIDDMGSALSGATSTSPTTGGNNTLSDISAQEWNILKSFAAIIITADDARDRGRDSVFFLKSVRIRERDYRGIDLYTVTNAVFVPYNNPRMTFANNVNGTFLYEEDEGLFEADLSAVFPNIDNKNHRFKLKLNNSLRPDMGSVIELDGKQISLSAAGLDSIMFSGGYEVVREYMMVF